MANYAIIENDTVTNVIVADSKEIAEEVTGLEAIEVTNEPWVGWQRVDGEWIDPCKPIEIVEEASEESPELED